MKFGDDATCEIDVLVPQTDSADAWVIATPIGREIEIRLHFCDQNISSSFAAMTIDLLCENIRFLVNAGIETPLPAVATRKEVVQRLPSPPKDDELNRPSSQQKPLVVPESAITATRALVRNAWEMTLGPLESPSTSEAVIEHTPFYEI